MRTLVVGKANEFQAVAEVYEEQADLTTFAPGDVVKFEVVTVNIAGESAPSEPASVMLTLAASA